MLRPLSLQTPLRGVLVEHECPRCGREVELPFGEICAQCRREIERRARKVGRFVSLSTTIVLAGYVYMRVPEDSTARMVSAMAILAWYLLTGAVTRRIMREVRK